MPRAFLFFFASSSSTLCYKARQLYNLCLQLLAAVQPLQQLLLECDLHLAWRTESVAALRANKGDRRLHTTSPKQKITRQDKPREKETERRRGGCLSSPTCRAGTLSTFPQCSRERRAHEDHRNQRSVCSSGTSSEMAEYNTTTAYIIGTPWQSLMRRNYVVYAPFIGFVPCGGRQMSI